MPENILETLRVAAGFGLASCIVSLLLTRLLLWLLPKWGMIDKPDFVRHIHKREEIVGLLALDARFVHSYCFGMKVLGTVDDLERVAKEHEIGKVLVTTEVGGEWMNSVQRKCRGIGVHLQRFKCAVESLEP